MINIFDGAVAKLKEGFKTILFVLLGLVSFNGLLKIIFFAVNGAPATNILSEILDTFIKVALILYAIFATSAHDRKRLGLAMTVSASYIFLLSVLSVGFTIFVNWYGDAVTVFYLIFNLIMTVLYIAAGIIVCRTYISDEHESDGLLKLISFIALIVMLFSFIFTIVECARGSLLWYEFIGPVINLGIILVFITYYFGVLPEKTEQID